MSSDPVLQQVLLQSNFVGLSASDAAIALGAIVSVPQPVSSYSFSGVMNALALAGCDQSILFDGETFIKSLIGGPSLYSMLTCPGLPNFALAGIQAQLAANLAMQTAANNSAAVQAINVMIGLGIVKMPLWQSLGISVSPTTDVITSALAVVTCQQLVATLMNEVLQPLIATGATLAQLKTAVAAFQGT